MILRFVRFMAQRLVPRESAMRRKQPSIVQFSDAYLLRFVLSRSRKHDRVSTRLGELLISEAVIVVTTCSHDLKEPCPELFQNLEGHL